MGKVRNQGSVGLVTSAKSKYVEEEHFAAVSSQVYPTGGALHGGHEGEEPKVSNMLGKALSSVLRRTSRNRRGEGQGNLTVSIPIQGFTWSALFLPAVWRCLSSCPSALGRGLHLFAEESRNLFDSTAARLTEHSTAQHTRHSTQEGITQAQKEQKGTRRVTKERELPSGEKRRTHPPPENYPDDRPVAVTDRSSPTPTIKGRHASHFGGERVRLG